MKVLLSSFICVSLIFLIVDMIWLSIMVKSFYRPNLSSLLTDKPVMWAAISFYLIYVIGLFIIVLEPALANNSLKQAFWYGLVLGIVAYGTYNFTNMATVSNWSPYVVFVDTAWGGVLTGSSSILGIFIAKKIFG